jgi:hypothetical protein
MELAIRFIIARHRPTLGGGNDIVVRRREVIASPAKAPPLSIDMNP